MTKPYHVSRNRNGTFTMTHKATGLKVGMPGKRVEEIEQAKVVLLDKVKRLNTGLDDDD